MTRLQKKCVIASILLHGFLILVLVVGPAFLSHREAETLPPIFEIVNLTDSSTRGGATDVVPEPAPAPAPTPAPAHVEPTPPEPTPVPPVAPPPDPTPVPQVKSRDVPVIPDPITKPLPRPPEQKPKPRDQKPVPADKHETTKPTVTKTPASVPAKTNKFELDFSKPTRIVKQSTSRPTAATSNSASDHSDLAKSLRNTIRGIEHDSTATVESPGSGGGELAVNYRQAVAAIYQDRYETELLGAGDIADGTATVSVKIVVGNDGRIIETKVTHASENAKLNDLVRRVLRKVTEVPQFPAGAKDPQREFNINFELKPKSGLG